ncbi:MAG TPA: hypothetical protein VJK26_02215 [Patescibacteria group bacterium]|nr:hypothetical protein [Patescibacteria group bacterium]
MQEVFLIIISALGVLYALFTRQAKIALGFLILAFSFVFAIPNLVAGVWQDVFGAVTMILYALAIFILVFKKRRAEKEEDSAS